MSSQPLRKPSHHKGGCNVVFPYLAKLHGINRFVETGSGNGSTLSYMHPIFKQCYSIERDSFSFEMVSDLFMYIPNVEVIHGDSGEVLAPLLARLMPMRTLFYLDAHGAPGQDDGPLAEEVRAIQIYCPDGLIAIDDVGQGTHHDVGLTSLSKAGVNLDGWIRDYRFGRIMFLYREGLYQIPELD